MSSEMEELTVTLDAAANDSCEANTDTLNHSLDLSDIATIRSEVHRKGLHLSETWTELFNLLGEYQGHLHRKENEIVAKELPPTGVFFDVGANSDALGHGVTMEENCMLKSKLSKKNLVLNQVQEELQTKKRLLGHYQDEMLNKERKILQLQEELRQSQQKSQRLENDLESRNEDLTIKDNLINKIQIQMVKEVGDLNNEVKKLQQCLDRERQRHENHMKQCNFQMNLLRQSQNQNIGPTATLSQAPIELPEVIDITDVDERQEKFQTHESRVLGSSFQTNPHRANVSNCVPTPVSLIPAPSQQVGTVDSGDLGKFPTDSDGVVQGNNFHERPNEVQDQVLFSMNCHLEQRGTFNESDSKLRPQPGTLPPMDWFATSSEFVGTEGESKSNPSNRLQTPPFAFSNEMSRNRTESAAIITMSPKTYTNNTAGGIQYQIASDHLSQQNVSKAKKGYHKGVYPCNVCGKLFTHPSNRHRHMLIHKGILSHQCSVCSKKFSRRDNLQSHMACHFKLNDCELVLETTS